VRSCIKGAGRTIGFVIAFSEDLILFHVVDMDAFQLNGYTLLRIDDIEDYRAFDKGEFWQNRAVRRFKLKPARPPGILLTSIPEFLKAVGMRYPLITIHRERIKPDVC